MKQSKPRRNVSDALPRLMRLFKIITLVNSRTPGERIGRKELAEACESSIITVHRDLELLANAAIVPVEYDGSARTYKIVERGWTFPVASWTPEDALALSLARSLLLTSDMPYSDLIRQAFDKILNQLTPALRTLLDECTSVLQVDPQYHDYSAAPLIEVTKCMIACKTIEIDYDSKRSGRDKRLIDPYSIGAKSGHMYVHGWCHRNLAILSFALDRIYSLEPTGAVFERRVAEWDAFDSAQGVVGGVRGEDTAVDLLFPEEVAYYVMRTKWEKGLTAAVQDDGSARVTGIASGTAGILPEILRWRRLCTVVGGPELRRVVMEEVQAMAQLYEQ